MHPIVESSSSPRGTTRDERPKSFDDFAPGGADWPLHSVESTLSIRRLRVFEEDRDQILYRFNVA